MIQSLEWTVLKTVLKNLPKNNNNPKFGTLKSYSCEKTTKKTNEKSQINTEILKSKTIMGGKNSQTDSSKSLLFKESSTLEVTHPVPDPNLPTVNPGSYNNLASGLACTGKPWRHESADQRRPAFTLPWTQTTLVLKWTRWLVTESVGEAAAALMCCDREMY